MAAKVDVGQLIFGLLWLVPLFFSIITGGWVLASYWDWFVVPLGAQPISFVHALGLSSILSIVFFNNFDKTDLAKCEKHKAQVKDGPIAYMWGTTFGRIVGLGGFWCWGWVLTQFM